MAGGDDNEDAQVRLWIEESKAIYANVANEAWLEWGQDILPHLATNSKEQGETKESLDEEERRRVEELDDAFANGPMSFEDREAGLKALRVEIEERRGKLGEATGFQAKESAKEAEVGESAKVSERGKEVEDMGDDNNEDLAKKGTDAEMVGARDVIDVDGEGAGGAEVTRSTTGTQDTTAGKPDTMVATSGTKAIEQKAKEQGEVAKESENAKEVADKIAEKKSRLRLMTPGRHDFRKVTGPVRGIFLHEIFAADLDFEVRSLRELESNVRLFEGLFPLCQV
jgi:hypothetical protein